MSVATLKPNFTDVERALGILHGNGRPFEVRIPLPAGGATSRWAAGKESLVKIIEQHSDAEKIWWSLNSINGNNQKNPLSDDDIVSLDCLFVEMDRAETTDNPASGDELTAMGETFTNLLNFLTPYNMVPRLTSMSGNGFHAYFALDSWPNDPEHVALVKQFLEAMAARFDCPAAKVDTVVGNPSRVATIPGTVSRKGAPTPERPHRVSAILQTFPKAAAVTAELVRRVLSENETRPRKKKPSTAVAGALVPKGQQDNWLTSQAGVYRRRGDSAEVIEQKLLIDYRERCAPPHDNERRVREIARGIERYPAGTTDLASTLPLTDGGNADYVLASYAGRIKHQKEGDIWYVADESCRWREDKVGEVSRLIETAMREKYEATARVVDPKDRERHRHALNSCNAVKIAHCAQVLRARKEVAVLPGTFDTDPWLLGVENGILDLRGEKEKLVEGDLSLLAAKRAPVHYVPEASCLRWDRYLERVQPDPEMRACLAQIFGACLTGVQNEKCFIFSLGDGGNGKSTFQRVMSDVLGDYAFKCKKALIFLPDKKSGEQAAGANDVADLTGMRLISATEQVGKHWNLEFIKDYTGGEKQYARQLYQRGSNFKPTAKIVIPANQEPVMDEFNEAIRRRFALLRWDVTLTPEEKQPFEPYVEWLMETSSGILNWALAGLAALKKNGMRLALPASAEDSTREYLDEQDEVSRFLRATYEDARAEELPVSEIYSRFKTTWLEEDHFVMSKNKFTRRLMSSFGKKRVRRGTGNRMMVVGLALRPEPLQEKKPRQGELDLGGK